MMILLGFVAGVMATLLTLVAMGGKVDAKFAIGAQKCPQCGYKPENKIETGA